MQDAAAATYPYMRPNIWHTLLIVLVAVVPLGLAIYAMASVWGTHLTWLNASLLLGFWAFSGLGISVGFHRFLAHGSFHAKAPLRFVMLLAGTMAVQGGPATWSATHRRHHAFSDKPGDPHSPLEGLMHAHWGWLMKGRLVDHGRAHEQLMRDPIVRFFEKTQFLWYGFSFIAPALIGLAVVGTWGAFWAGALWGGAVRVFLMHHITWSINSICHTIGTRPYNSPDVARNNALFGVLGFGEGWHNNHHAFPNSAYLGHRWYQFDPGRYLIWTFQKLGWVERVQYPTRAARKKRSRTRLPTPAGDKAPVPAEV